MTSAHVRDLTAHAGANGLGTISNLVWSPGYGEKVEPH